MTRRLLSGDWETTGEQAEDLLYRLDRGRFAPEITGHKEFDKIVAKNACDAIMTWDVV